MMFGFGSFNLINEFERASNSARLQPYAHRVDKKLFNILRDDLLFSFFLNFFKVGLC